MGNRLHIDFTVLLDVNKDINGTIMKRIRQEMRTGMLDIRFQAAANKAYAKMEQDEGTADRRETDYVWLEVRACFSNNDNKFQELWRAIRPIMCNYAKEETPVGYWFDDNKYGLIHINEPLRTVNK